MLKSKSKTNHKLSGVFYALAIGLMVVFGLSYCQAVLIPIALSVLLAFILNPLVQVFERWRFGRVPSVLLASTLAFSVIGLASWALAGQIKLLADELPSHTKEIKAKIAAFETSQSSTLGRLSNMVQEIFPVEAPVVPVPETGSVTKPAEPTIQTVIIAKDPNAKMSTAAETLLPVVEPLANVALVIVMVLFLLLRREDMRYRVISLMGDTALTGTTRLMRDAADRVSNYLLHLLVVNALFGLWFGAGLYFLGVPYAPLWGALTLFLRFIPFLGSPASVLFPLLISIATSTGWGEPLGVLIFFAISELVTANVIEPVVFGKTTGLTPIALLIAALFWAWIWGPIGLLLSTPLTVCVVVLGQHIPQLRSLKVLLAEQPVLEARLQYFQRLLAQDKLEARRVIDQYTLEFDQAKSFDEVIVPALRWTRRERMKEMIDAKEEELIWQTNNAILADLKRDRISAAVDSDSSAQNNDSDVNENIVVYGYPVHHKSEEIALEMLEELLAEHHRMKFCTTAKLPSKAINEIKSLRPAVVVLTVLPPGGLPQAKYMCTQLCNQSSDMELIVMYLGTMSDYDNFLVEIRQAGASYLTTSLIQTQKQIEAILNEREPKDAVEPHPDLVATPDVAEALDDRVRGDYSMSDGYEMDQTEARQIGSPIKIESAARNDAVNLLK
jgi:predicted PurR-regulated permease PerM